MKLFIKSRFTISQLMEFEKNPDVVNQKCKTTCIVLLGFIVYSIISVIPSLMRGYAHGVVTNVFIAILFSTAALLIHIEKKNIFYVVTGTYALNVLLFIHFIMETDWTMGMDAFWLFILITPFITDYLVGPVYGTIAAFSGLLLSIALFHTDMNLYLQPYGLNMTQWYSTIYIVVMISAAAIVYELTAYQIEKRDSDEKIAYYERERVKKLKEQLSIYENNEHTIRKYKHDLRHYNRVLAGYIEEKDYDKAANYLKEFDSLLETVTAVSFCDNQIVNELLTIYASRCQKLGFKLRVKASVPEKFPMEELDLTSLLANAMENALEAQEKVPEKERSIQVEINYDGKKLKLFTKNPCAIINTFGEDGLPVSTREIPSGIGTEQIKEISEKYSGIASFTQEGDFFILRAIMTCV
ncbi:sensor histidine kinase [Butyrivibrio proteoclasticus]|uniref:sensor histidine kinase n=1 Tax=Butyrivibrio proteoclasticus TaxID=43305 RepID=UPI00047A25EC|nr:GHKL domain-containing protein [Butyrivibrio proteoclasticus]